MSEDARQTGGQAVVQVMQAHGLNTVSCLAGAAHAPLLRDLEAAQFHIVPSRHENATVGVADGYARVTGKVGVAMIAGLQGLPNALGGVRTAQLACSPVVLMISVGGGQSESMDEETNDLLDMVKPFVKWAKTVPDPERLEEYLNAAFHRAASGRPGVAVIGIPTRFYAAQLECKSGFPSFKHTPTPPDPSAAAIQQAAEILASAERPLILCGSGAALSGAGEALRALSADFGVPVFGHALGRGLVPEDMIHGFPWALAQPAAKHADVVIAVGVRLTQRLGFGLSPRFAADAHFIQVDIEPAELGRNRTIDLPIQADARRTVEALHAALSDAKLAKRRTDWVNQALELRLSRIDELGRGDDGPTHPYRIGRELMAAMPPETIFVADGADIYNWMSAVVRIRADRSYMDHYPLGSMGMGTPLALGAAAGAREMTEQTGAPERPVVLVTGDGSFGFYPAEFNSAQLAGLKIVCIISNDGNWGTERNELLRKLGTSVNCVIGQCDYHLVAQGFGCRGEKVEAPADVAAALRRAFDAEGSTVLNVLTDTDAGMQRKQDPRLQMVTFEDLRLSLDAHHVVDVS